MALSMSEGKSHFHAEMGMDEDPKKKIYPPEVTLRKVKNGIHVTKRGGDINPEYYDYRGLELVFDTASEAAKACAPFLETGEISKDYK